MTLSQGQQEPTKHWVKDSQSRKCERNKDAGYGWQQSRSVSYLIASDLNTFAFSRWQGGSAALSLSLSLSTSLLLWIAFPVGRWYLLQRLQTYSHFRMWPMTSHRSTPNSNPARHLRSLDTDDYMLTIFVLTSQTFLQRSRIIIRKSICTRNLNSWNLPALVGINSTWCLKRLNYYSTNFYIWIGRYISISTYIHETL